MTRRPGKIGTALAMLFGALLLWAGLTGVHDHSVLADRGATADAEIVEVDRNSVEVRFTTAAGQTVQATVEDPPTTTDERVGGHVQVRYDPQDPTGRIEAADGDPAIFTRWFLVLGGGTIMAAGVYYLIWTRGKLNRWE